MNRTRANWLLLQVKPRQEMRALENLERQNGECYCPQIQLVKLSRGKRIQVKEALFSGYLFFNALSEQNGLTYTSIRSSRGVSKIVSFGVEPIKIPEGLIQKIKLGEQARLIAGKAEGLAQAGDQVDIQDGPFKGLQAIYSHADGQQRSIVLVHLLNQRIPVSLASIRVKNRS